MSATGEPNQMTGSYKPYRVVCTWAGCTQAAEYKIAAQWSDGSFMELKPYCFACARHVGELYQRAKQKQAECRLSPGESLGPVSIYRFYPNLGDRQLEPLEEPESLPAPRDKKPSRK